MTATDVAVAIPETLVDVRSGELLPATAENAAELLVAMREMRARILDLQKDCEAVLLEESRRQGTKTLHLPGGTATVTGGPTVEYDAEALMALLRESGCPEARIDEAVEATVTYKTNRSVLRQLGASNQDYRAAIELAAVAVEKPYRVGVK